MDGDGDDDGGERIGTRTGILKRKSNNIWIYGWRRLPPTLLGNYVQQRVMALMLHLHTPS
jgi:hypothetical protein